MAQGAQNIGFALPINKAKRDIESVKRSGKIQTAFLGVRYTIITKEIAERDKLPVDHGVVVRGSDAGPAVIPESPALHAGLQAEDIILELNGEKISENQTLASLLQKHNVGEKIKLKALRAGKEFILDVTLGERSQ